MLRDIRVLTLNADPNDIVEMCKTAGVDFFWFTFFHDEMHLLLHSEKKRSFTADIAHGIVVGRAAPR